jgi:hypothetical protein
VDAYITLTLQPKYQSTFLKTQVSWLLVCPSTYISLVLTHNHTSSLTELKENSGIKCTEKSAIQISYPNIILKNFLSLDAGDRISNDKTLVKSYTK